MSEQESREFAVALGAEIAHWRKLRKLNRAQLSEKVDISETTLGRIERGSEDAAAAASLVWRIAAALGLPFSDLVQRAEQALDLSAASDTPDLTQGGAPLAANNKMNFEKDHEEPDTP